MTITERHAFIPLSSSKEDDASMALSTCVEEINLKEINQLTAAMAKPSWHWLAIVIIALGMAVTTTNIYWALTMCQALCAKCFIFIISFIFLTRL